MPKKHSKSRSTKKTAFVIAPIGERKSEIRRWSDEVSKSLIEPIAKKLGYTAVRADQISRTGLITNQIMSHIFNDALVIADLTGYNPNVFYELGVRHTIQKPVIILIDAEDKIPFDLTNSRAIKLHKDWSGLDEAKEEFSKQIMNLEGQDVYESIVTPFINDFLGEEVIKEKLLTTLDDTKLRLLIEKAVNAIRGQAVKKEIYAVFDKYLLEELVGVTTKERVYDLELSPETYAEQQLTRVNIATSYTAVNESTSNKQLFHDDIIGKGRVWPPASIPPEKLPDNPSEIFSYIPDQFFINGKQVHPEIELKWTAAPDGKTRVVEYSSKLSAVIRPGEEKDVSFRCSSLQDQHDYVMRAHRSICDRVTVNVTKPKDTRVVCIWFKTAESPHIKVFPPSEGQQHYNQTVKGIMIPGNGVAICWRRQA